MRKKMAGNDPAQYVFQDSGHMYWLALIPSSRLVLGA
jgi:hypothetical protein